MRSPHGRFSTSDLKLAVGLLRVQDATHPSNSAAVRNFFIQMYSGKVRFCWNLMAPGAAKQDMVFAQDWFCPRCGMSVHQKAAFCGPCHDRSGDTVPSSTPLYVVGHGENVDIP